MHEPGLYVQHTALIHRFQTEHVIHKMPHTQGPLATTQPAKPMRLTAKPTQHNIDLAVLQLDEWARATQIWDGKDTTHISADHFMTIQATVEGTLAPAQWSKAHHGKDIAEYRSVKSSRIKEWRTLISGTRTMDTILQTATDLVKRTPDIRHIRSWGQNDHKAVPTSIRPLRETNPRDPEKQEAPALWQS